MDLQQEFNENLVLQPAQENQEEQKLSSVIQDKLPDNQEYLDDEEDKSNLVSTEIQHDKLQQLKEQPTEQKKSQENIFAHTQLNETNEFAQAPQTSEPTEQEIDLAIEEMSVKGICPPENLQPYIYQTLTRRRVDAICNSDYDLAEKQDKLSAILGEYIKYQKAQRKHEVRGDILYNRYLTLHSSLKEVNEKYDQKKNDYIEQSNKRKNDLMSQHQELEANIFAKYSDPSFLRQFSKASQKLAELRENEVALAVQRNYTAAKTIKAEADALEKVETEAAQRKIFEAQQAEMQALTENYAAIIKAHDEKVAEQVILIEAERKKELAPIEAAIKQIYVKTPILPALRPSSEARSGPAPTRKSPRTQMKLRSYISNKRPNVLPITPNTSPMMKRQPPSRSMKKPMRR